MTAHLVYARDSLNRALGSIQSRHHFIRTLLICFSTRALVSSFGLQARTCFPVESKITSLNGIPRSCASSCNNHGINASTAAFSVLEGTVAVCAFTFESAITLTVIPTPQTRERDLANAHLKIGFISNHRRRPQQWQNLFKSVACSRMHTHERFVSLHTLANFFQIGNADGQINFVVYLLAASPKQE